MRDPECAYNASAERERNDKAMSGRMSGRLRPHAEVLDGLGEEADAGGMKGVVEETFWSSEPASGIGAPLIVVVSKVA